MPFENYNLLTYFQCFHVEIHDLFSLPLAYSTASGSSSPAVTATTKSQLSIMYRSAINDEVNKRDICSDRLIEMLKQGPLPCKDIMKELESYSIAPRTIVFPPCLYCFAVSYCSFIIPGKGNIFNKQLDRIVGFLGIQLPKSIFISS